MYSSNKWPGDLGSHWLASPQRTSHGAFYECRYVQIHWKSVIVTLKSSSSRAWIPTCLWNNCSAHCAGYIGLSDTYTKQNLFDALNPTYKMLTKQELTRIEALDMNDGSEAFRELTTWVLKEIMKAQNDGLIEGRFAGEMRDKVLSFRAAMESVYDYHDQPIHVRKISSHDCRCVKCIYSDTHTNDFVVLLHSFLESFDSHLSSRLCYFDGLLGRRGWRSALVVWFTLWSRGIGAVHICRRFAPLRTKVTRPIWKWPGGFERVALHSRRLEDQSACFGHGFSYRYGPRKGAWPCLVKCIHRASLGYNLEEKITTGHSILCLKYGGRHCLCWWSYAF